MGATAAAALAVACAVIEKDGLVLAAQRSRSMGHPLKWEFPGGKIEPGEDAVTCIKREIVEELGVEVAVVAALPLSRWCYADFTIELHPFVCRISRGILKATEHQALRWLAPEELPTLDWADADVAVARSYLATLPSNCSK